jgi:hypothetical protein
MTSLAAAMLQGRSIVPRWIREQELRGDDLSLDFARAGAIV